MKKMRFAIIGLGRLGHKCVEAVSAGQDTELAGIVASKFKTDIPVVTHVSELKNVDAAFICVPADAVFGRCRKPAAKPHPYSGMCASPRRRLPQA